MKMKEVMERGKQARVWHIIGAHCMVAIVIIYVKQ